MRKSSFGQGYEEKFIRERIREKVYLGKDMRKSSLEKGYEKKFIWERISRNADVKEGESDYVA